MPLSVYGAVVATDIFGILVCIVLLLVSRYTHRDKNKRTRIFEWMLVTNMVASTADALSWLLDGRAELLPLLWTFAFITVIGNLILMWEYLCFIRAYVSEKSRVARVIRELTHGISAVVFFVTVILCFQGEVFAFENARFVSKPFYYVYIIMLLAMLVFALGVVTAFRKIMSKAARIVAYAYIIIPTVSAVIFLFLRDNPCAYAAPTLSLLLISHVIQSEKMNDLERINEIEQYHATHDQLTGLNNRRAYEERLAVLRESNGNCGVLFADVNGLKYTNDHYGHAEGDQLLIRFSTILTDIFRNNEIYRISGDEFICILEDPPEEIFEKRVKEFRERISGGEVPMASCGAAFGSGQEIDRCIKEAEDKMYIEKEDCHRRFATTKRD